MDTYINEVIDHGIEDLADLAGLDEDEVLERVENIRKSMVSNPLLIEALTSVLSFDSGLQESKKLELLFSYLEVSTVRQAVANKLAELSREKRAAGFQLQMGYSRDLGLGLQLASAQKAREGRIVNDEEERIEREISELRKTKAVLREKFELRWANLVEYEGISKDIKSRREGVWTRTWLDMTPAARKAYSGGVKEFKRFKLQQEV